MRINTTQTNNLRGVNFCCFSFVSNPLVTGKEVKKTQPGKHGAKKENRAGRRPARWRWALRADQFDGLTAREVFYLSSNSIARRKNSDLLMLSRFRYSSMRPDNSGLIRVENERYAFALYRAFTCQLVCVFRFGFSKFSIDFQLLSC